jgi:hypothetical protein
LFVFYLFLFLLLLIDKTKQKKTKSNKQKRQKNKKGSEPPATAEHAFSLFHVPSQIFFTVLDTHDFISYGALQKIKSSAKGTKRSDLYFNQGIKNS